MSLLFFYLFLALGVSFVCSILEAVILSISPGFIEATEKQHPQRGATLRELKKHIDRPLAAILSLNTIAHTIGAAGVGAQALVVFGSGWVSLTSVILTFLILVFSEIIPKTLGAYYWHRLADFTAWILPALIWLMYPLVILARKISRLLATESAISRISREEIRAMSDLARREGIFGEQESRILKNLLQLSKLKAKDIMTPRPVVFSLPADKSISAVMENRETIRFSRIPVYGSDQDDIHSYVLKNEIVLEAARDNDAVTLSSLTRPITVLPDGTGIVTVFEKFLDQREHIALVVDEYGVPAGIVTMEDVVETMLGIEIVDETDKVVDMQALARRQWLRRARGVGLVKDGDNADPGAGN